MRFASLLLFCLSLLARTPDCQFNFSFTGAGDSVPYANTCPYLWFTYHSSGFSGITVTLQGAPDSSGSPGTWITLDGSVTIGSNPATSTTGAYVAITATNTDLAAWLRIDISGVSGSGQISGQVYGYLDLEGLGDEEDLFACAALELPRGVALTDRRRYA